jgi:hypothetical protein
LEEFEESHDANEGRREEKKVFWLGKGEFPDIHGGELIKAGQNEEGHQAQPKQDGENVASLLGFL